MRISSSVKKHPEHCEVRTILEGDKTLITASYLITAMQAAVPHTAKAKLRHAKELQNLTAIIENTSNVREAPTATPTVSTSTYTTSPRVIQKTPSVHQRQTRRNMPMPTINEINDPNCKNDTQQKSPPTKPTILLPNRRRCQPPRMAKERTVEGQIIGSKYNDTKNTPRKRIQSLINQQKEQDLNIELYTNADSQIENVPNKECSIPVQQTDTYDMPTPEHSDQRPITITQDES